MPTLEKRRIVRQGGAYMVSLPQGWLRYHKLGKGDTLEVLTNGVLTLRPLKKQAKK